MKRLYIDKTSKREGRGSLLAVKVERDSFSGEYPYRIEVVDGELWIGEERTQLIILRNQLRAEQR